MYLGQDHFLGTFQEAYFTFFSTKPLVNAQKSQDKVRLDELRRVEWSEGVMKGSRKDDKRMNVLLQPDDVSTQQASYFHLEHNGMINGPSLICFSGA